MNGTITNAMERKRRRIFQGWSELQARVADAELEWRQAKDNLREAARELRQARGALAAYNEKHYPPTEE